MEELGRALSILSEGLNSLAKGIEVISRQVDQQSKERGKHKTKKKVVEKVKKAVVNKTAAKKRTAKKTAVKKTVAKKISAKKKKPVAVNTTSKTTDIETAGFEVTLAEDKDADKQADDDSPSDKKLNRASAKKYVGTGHSASKIGKTHFQMVYELIQNSAENVTNSYIMEKTGFQKRQVANILFKLKKQQKIKPAGRGAYIPA